MPFILNDTHYSPLVRDYDFEIINKDLLAEYVGQMVLGHHHHINKILNALSSLPPLTPNNSIDQVINQINTASITKRDGWLFQMISWIVLAQRNLGQKFYANYPHFAPAQHGIDGLAIILSEENELKKIIITEDKCTTNPRNKIQQQVFKEFKAFEKGEKDNALISIISSLIGPLDSGAIFESVQNDIFNNDLRIYRIGITRKDEHNNDTGRQSLFSGYDTCVTGTTFERRSGSTVYLPDMRNWMQDFSDKVITYLESKKHQMYNSATEQKIKNIPIVGEIDIERLPQQLTRIYAQIVSLRHKVADGTIDFRDEDFISNLNLLRSLANNLETFLLSHPDHEQKEAIAFVAATAYSLIHKIGFTNSNLVSPFEIDSISSYIAATILFLIGNSQADSAETALSIDQSKVENITQQRLIASIISIATGEFSNIDEISFNEKEVIEENDMQQTALNYLWRELGLGIVDISKRLVGQSVLEKVNPFEKVIELSVSESGLFEQKNVYSGPFRLAKLLKLLEGDIFNRSVININPPSGVDPTAWDLFLEKLAKTRPYLWENHREAVNTNFLNPGVSAVLTLPTGAGKSTLSELKIASCLYSDKKVIYLVPTHALEDQVNRNLKSLFTDFEPSSFELDSEFTEIDGPNNFSILVTTPERCLTLLNIDPDFFRTVGLVVFDEFHLIHGKDIKKDRRSIDAMYCLLSLFSIRPDADYLLISAMVANGEEIASWIEAVTLRECKLFNSTWKPTRQLHGCLVFEENEITQLQRNIKIQQTEGKTKNPSSDLKRSTNITPHCIFSLKNIWETAANKDYYITNILNQNVYLGINNWWSLTSNRNVIAADLAIHFSKLGLKTLVFVDDPRFTNSTSKTISNALGTNEISYEYFVSRNKSLIHSLELELGNIEHSYFNDCKSVGVHHGLLLPAERSLIESYFKSANGLQVLVATATLAQGINLPAEIVIIAGDDRYDEEGGTRQRVDPHELLNAAGRAGRAGLSSQGAVILIPGDIVTIKNSRISNRWWQLKNEVFSKGDQCLEIEDPFGYFLDSLHERLQDLTVDQTNILYRFKPENVSENEARKLLGNSFYAYKLAESENAEQFETQVQRLLDRRNELDSLSEEEEWQKELALKSGVDPLIIFELDNAIVQEDPESSFLNSIPDTIDWFFNWLSSDEQFVEKIFTKQGTLDQIKKVVGVKPDTPTSELINKLPILSNCLKSFVQGVPLNGINELIPNVGKADSSGYLMKARRFVNRLIPELSFGFGLLSMILIERLTIEGFEKEDIPTDIKTLASCIREGFDTSDKLFFKKNYGLQMRVETHVEYEKQDEQ